MVRLNKRTVGRKPKERGRLPPEYFPAPGSLGSKKAQAICTPQVLINDLWRYFSFHITPIILLWRPIRMHHNTALHI